MPGGPPSLEQRLGLGTQTITVRGLRVRVASRGHGPGLATSPPLLLIGGIGANIEMWRPLLAELPGLATIAFDAPGTGASDMPRWPMRMRQLSQFVSSLLDEFGHDRVDVLGYSFGGALAQQLALDSPTRVRRLVLAATNSGAVSLPGTPRAFMHLLSPRRYYSTAHLERVLPVIAGGRTARDSEQPKRDAKARVALPPTLWGYQSQLVAIAGWTSAFWLQHLTQSTLVLSGDDDPLVPLANARFLARRIPDARLHVVAGGGHLFLIDQPRDAAPVLNAFLACPDTGATPWSNHRQT